MIRSPLISSLLIALLSLLIAAPASANVPTPVRFRPVLDYSAQVAADGSHWRLFDLGGRSLGVQAQTDCTPASLPQGLWLVTRGADGDLELLAPSALPLPAGHAGRIALRACTAQVADDSRALQVPDMVLRWLADNGGAVRVGG